MNEMNETYTCRKGYFGMGHIYNRKGAWMLDFADYAVALRVTEQLNGTLQ